MTRVARLLGAALGCAAGLANAQLIDFNVTGAVEETRVFDTLQRPSPGSGQTWQIQGKLLVVYRLTAPTDSVTIQATLVANTLPRTQTGGEQFISINTIITNTILDGAAGPPDEALTVSHTVPASPTVIGRQAFLVTAGPFPGTCNLHGACSSVYVYVVLLNEPAPRLAILAGPSFPVVLGPPPPTFLQMSLFGLNPLTDVQHVAIDGVPLTRIPSGVLPLNQSPGAGNWDRIPQDPLPPASMQFPGSDTTSPEVFIGCGGGGCGSPGLRIGMPATMGPGPHTLSVSGEPYQATVYTYWSDPATYGLVTAASPGAEGDFIVLDPQLQVSPSQAEPGSTVTLTGTGFAPSNEIPLRLSVHCCGSQVSLGTAHVNPIGAFSQQVVLPAANVPPFSGTWSSSAPPGSPAPGSILADYADAAFVAQYGFRGGPESASITFLKPGATPTTTTLPPQPCSSEAQCDDGDRCTDDTCPAGVCIHAPRAGPSSVQCALPPTGVRPPVCAADTIPRRTEKQYRKATGFIDRAINRTGNAVRRLIKKADKALKRAGRAVEVANLAGKVSDECAQGITDVIDDVRDRIKLVLQ